MKRDPATQETYSPPEVAKKWGVDPSKILLWIRRGELGAFNAATSTSGRPRFRITLAAMQEFERRRSATAPAPLPRVPRRPIKKIPQYV